MASMVIRDLDDEVKARLRLRAAEHGRSMEAEARAILASVLDVHRPSRGLGSYVRDRFADLGGVELPIPDRTDRPRAVTFES